MGSFYLLTLKAEFKCKKQKIVSERKKLKSGNFVHFVQPRFLRSETCSWRWKKQVIVRGDGLGLGKLKIYIVISTYIEHIGEVSKVVYEQGDSQTFRWILVAKYCNNIVIQYIYIELVVYIYVGTFISTYVEHIWENI